MAIVNEVDSNPTLQVSNLMIGSDGTWKRVRSLGGPLAAEWLSMHQNGSPNTTVAWYERAAIHRFIFTPGCLLLTGLMARS